MHIEPEIVQGAKIVLSYGTAVVSFGIAVKSALESIQKSGILPLIVKTFITSLLVLMFFEIFPHTSVGVSEVHLILGSTLFLIFGAAPAALGLAIGLLIQGLFFAQFDLPQYGMNVTTLLMPLFAMAFMAKKIIPQNIAYKDIKYIDALKLSVIFQGGIVTWVAFWALFGGGVGIENLTSVFSFGAAYMSVIILEPLVDLAVLAGAKALHSLQNSPFVNNRLYNSAV